MMKTTSRKTRKPSPKEAEEEEEEEEEMEVIPGLPNHIAQILLSLVKNPHLLFSVSHSWRRLLYSSNYPPFLSFYTLLSSSSFSSFHLSSFDPISSTWHPLPPPPLSPHRPLLLRHPSFISRNLPIQSLSVSNHLLLLSATTHHLLPALSHPLVFNPTTQKWRLGPSFTSPRRWCVTGSVNGTVFLASGIGAEYNPVTARSAEKWEFSTAGRCFGSEFGSCLSQTRWEGVAEMKNGRFSREAVEGVGWKGKVCMVNSIKDGAIYHIQKNVWEEMPEGMLKGWNGPAAAMDENEIYVVDEERGILLRYVEQGDAWEQVVECGLMKGAAKMAAAGGRVCVVCCEDSGVVVVDVAVRPVRYWLVHAPEESKVVGVHVLPRMSRDV